MHAASPLEEMLDRIVSERRPDGLSLSLYLMIDQSGLPDIRKLWPALSSLAWEPIMGSSRLAQPDGAIPLLLDISTVTADAGPRRAVRLVYDHGRFANCLCVLQSRLDLAPLAAALRERTRAELPDRLAVVLRYFDTRTLPLLPRLLTPLQFALFMSCVQVWDYVDRLGQMQTLHRRDAPPAEPAPFAPLMFDALQERLLIDDGLADAVIDQLLDQHHPALAEAAPGQQFARVAALLDTGDSYGIDDVLDAVRYCCAAFEHGDDFHLREAWAARLQQAQLGRIGFEAALDDGA